MAESQLPTRTEAEQRLLDAVEAEGWPAHVQALYEEIAALSTALGMPTPRLSAAGLSSGGPGTILASFQQLGTAVKQLQGIALANEARTRAMLAAICEIDPLRAPMYRAMVEQAVDIARQEQDPDKIAARRKTGVILDS